MDNKSTSILEFDRVRENLSGFTHFSTSRELATAITPVSDYDTISRSLKQSAEARRLLSLEPGFSIGRVSDVRPAARMAALGRVLEPAELLEINCTLEAVRKLGSRLSKLSGEVPLLYEIARGISKLPSLEAAINRCISASGEIPDSASPALNTIRHQLKGLREQLLDRLHAIINSPKGQRITQEPIVTEREGRYVIPVKIESRGDIKGVVHDISNSGATLFIEPWSTLAMGNELRELTLREKHEIERILTRLSADVAGCEEEISRNIVLTAELDLALAKARYAAKSGATEPLLIPADKSEAGARLRLLSARHPLLGEKAVPMNLEIGNDFSILVITGPNTGGKTVALKTIGLLCLMAQAGLPIPASESSRLPVFDGIYADIGDEQSIEQTLSTFSWHIGNIARIINSATTHSLVLLDELGVSTDPAEGSALARSILLHFLSLGAITVATTHYSDLKAFAHTMDGFQNASLDFDAVTYEPTYHLSIGTPGGSNAMATAARLGLDNQIVDRAREMMTGGAQELESLLADLMNEKEKVFSLRKDLEQQMADVQKRKSELDRRVESLQTEERRIIQETRDSVVKQAARLHREIQRAASELRKEKKQEAVERTRQTLTEVQRRLKDYEWQADASTAASVETEGDSHIKPGDTVWLKEAKIAGRVLSFTEDNQQVEIQAGQTRLSLSLDRVARKAPSGGEAPGRVSRTTIKSEAGAIPMELDLRGRRAGEVETELDTYLNDASLANLSEVRVVHGIGSGALRSIVRDCLASHPLVSNFRCGGQKEGGDGVTVISL
ncbi:MAG: endonuclease MutS2 [Dehalococcoidales bacterium]